MANVIGWDVILQDTPNKILEFFVSTWSWPRIKVEKDKPLEELGILAYCLQSDLLDSKSTINNAEQAYGYVELEFLPLINGVIRLHIKGEYSPVSLYVVYERLSNGNRGKAFSRLTTSTMPLGFNLQGALQKNVSDWLTHALFPNEHMKQVLHLLQKENAFTWYEMYKMFEIIRKDLSSESNVVANLGVSQQDIIDFRQSANAAGARHAVSQANMVLNISDAEIFIRKLCFNWLDFKLMPNPTTTTSPVTNKP